MRSAALCLFLLTTALAGRIEYRVQQGDTAFSIARRHGVTVEALLSQNGLATTDLKVGQMLVVDVPGAPAVLPVPPATPTTTSPATYTVVAGDSLYAIARRLSLRVEDIVELNGLTSIDLKIGQVLRLPPGGSTVGPTSTPAPSVANEVPAASQVKAAAPSPGPVITSPVAPAPVVSSPFVTVPPAVTVPPLAPVAPATWRDRALALLGVPYVLGGTTPQGLDCSGLVLMAMSPMGLNLPRRSADMFQTGMPVNRADLREGDLVFFDTEGRGQASHVGIYLGLDVFVHANTYSGRVTVNAMSEKYYADRYLGSRRVMTTTASR